MSDVLIVEGRTFDDILAEIEAAQGQHVVGDPSDYHPRRAYAKEGLIYVNAATMDTRHLHETCSARRHSCYTMEHVGNKSRRNWSMLSFVATRNDGERERTLVLETSVDQAVFNARVQQFIG